MASGSEAKISNVLHIEPVSGGAKGVGVTNVRRKTPTPHKISLTTG
ncbi:hypothetical protein CCACVL1_21538 [Corchorus capsularis]|uniref:Uncharacterized protein n=1 Tax=Corchorus capsularis TaxID=210143 RepID=A0A1R3H4Y3_COCAP|nr:hypothetical protein CCACVL1_21538 [Corchorus capsularis]